MRRRSTFKFLIIIVFVAFSLKALSEITFSKGTNGKEKNPELINLSIGIFPVVSEYYYEYGKILINRYVKDKNIKVLKASRRMFEKAISLNNLNFSSHFLLGRSYLLSDSSDPGDFEKGLRLIKNASSIRKTNLSINVDTIKIFLSLWPFLEQKDKDTAISLMKLSIGLIDSKRFEKIMETWGYYSKDSDFLPSVLNNNGRHYQIVHKELIKQELNIEFRHRLLAQSEYLILNKSESDISKFTNDIKKLTSLNKKLNNGIKGYYKFSTGTRFRETAYLNLRKELTVKLLKLLLKDLSLNNIPIILKLSESYIFSFDSVRDVEVLYEMLKQKKFFNSNDINVFYLKQLISYKTGQVAKMISEIEGFRQSVTFVKEGHEKNLVRLLLLLTDAYISSRLLTKAVEILKEIEKILPGMTRTYWRLLRIESVIGEDPFFNKLRDEKFPIVRNSHSILINKPVINTTVYPFKTENLIIDSDEDFKEKLKRFHLLQIFINGKIFYEQYIGSIKFPLILSLTDELKKSDFKVDIKLK